MWLLTWPYYNDRNSIFIRFFCFLVILKITPYIKKNRLPVAQNVTIKIVGKKNRDGYSSVMRKNQNITIRYSHPPYTFEDENHAISHYKAAYKDLGYKGKIKVKLHEIIPY